MSNENWFDDGCRCFLSCPSKPADSQLEKMKTLLLVYRHRRLSLGRITFAATLICAGLVTIALTMFSGVALAAPGTNLPGKDYTHFPAPSAFVCRNSCGGDPRCQAYTWVKPGIQGPSGQCWLKHTLPKIVKDPCCDSGPRNFISAGDLKREDKINRPGLDFKNFNTNSWKQCEAACAENQICSSWSYVLPGVQGPTGRCWLKNGVAWPVPEPNAVSGVKFRRASVPFD